MTRVAVDRRRIDLCQEMPDSKGSPMNGKLRIAVADDEQDMRDFLERMLPLMGHEVVCVAETGRELVQHCRRLKPDLIITDIKMPDTDGIEAATEICNEQPVPVIL